MLLIVACHHQREKIIILQEAEEKVLSLLLTQKINEYIDKFSHGKHGVSILSDSLLIDNKYFYELQKGCLRNPFSEMKEAKNIWFLRNK